MLQNRNSLRWCWAKEQVDLQLLGMCAGGILLLGRFCRRSLLECWVPKPLVSFRELGITDSGLPQIRFSSDSGAFLH